MRPVITAVEDEQFVVVKYWLDYTKMRALIKFNEVNDAPAGSTLISDATKVEKIRALVVSQVQ